MITMWIKLLNYSIIIVKKYLMNPIYSSTLFLSSAATKKKCPSIHYFQLSLTIFFKYSTTRKNTNFRRQHIKLSGLSSIEYTKNYLVPILRKDTCRLHSITRETSHMYSYSVIAFHSTTHARNQLKQKVFSATGIRIVTVSLR